MAVNNSATELFGRQQAVIARPITADMCMLTWYPEATNVATANFVGPVEEKILTGATNVTISYQQQVTRRRTLASAAGKPLAVIYPSQPIGSIQIQRLFADFAGAGVSNAGGTHDLFQFAGWNICVGTAGIDVTFDGATAYAGCSLKNPGFRISGATVTGYNITAEAEGLTIIDNISVEFMQMFQLA